MNCVFCWLIGHNFKVKTEVKEWINEKGTKERMTHYTEVSHCTRCNAVNQRIQAIISEGSRLVEERRDEPSIDFRDVLD